MEETEGTEDFLELIIGTVTPDPELRTRCRKRGHRTEGTQLFWDDQWNATRQLGVKRGAWHGMVLRVRVINPKKSSVPSVSSVRDSLFSPGLT